MQNIKSMSFLLSKYVDKINPATTGWVRPDGVINFANKDAAKNYAVNICISANKQKDKIERAVIVKDNMVLTKNNGKKYSVNVDYNKLSGYKDCDFYHNHPTPGTLSLHDYCLLKSKKCIKTITAVDILGQYYKMTKLPLEKIKFLPRIISNFLVRYSQLQIAALKYEKFEVKYKIKADKLNNEYKMCKTNNNKSEKSDIIKKILDNQSIFISNVHKMWQDNAQKFGIKYEYGNI